MHSRGAAQILTIPIAIGLVLLGGACSSSSSSAKSSSAFSKGLVTFYSPAKGSAPVLSSTFTSCVAKGLKPADQDAVAAKKSVSDSLALSDAISIRVVRASEHCDHATTAKGVQQRILDPSESPFHLTAAQKACSSGKLTQTMSALDDSKVQGSFSADLNNAITRAFSTCIPLSKYIGGLVSAQLTSTTPAQAQCVGDAVAKTTTFDQLINQPDAVNATVTAALSTCGVKTS